MEQEMIYFKFIIIVIFVVIAIFTIYVVVSSIKQRKLFNVQTVTTGDVLYNTDDISNPVPIDKIILFGKKFVVKGKTFNSADYIRVRAGGSSMKKRGINNGDIIFASKVDSDFLKKKKDKIHPNDVLLLRLNDERYEGYKIRVFKQYAVNGELETYYYNKDGSEHNSSRTHSLDRVVGIVKYKIVNS
ncbi:hypothetical protein FACS189467_7490 [Bacteroidia bacterium]|nr:hypothetical protein FACS189467_7490 [Bacteroidia bacterium]